jgi:mannose-1-phosphate guanylyltransferase/mannose-6-phosphate isomerase
MSKEIAIQPVILSGGSGTRLWPLSREAYPKQLIPLVDDHSLLQNTALRLNGMKEVIAPLIICNHAHRFLVAEQMRQIDIDPAAIILEPFGRNTAPAIAIAALHAQNPDTLLLVLAADHAIQNISAFQQAVKDGMQYAQQGKLVTFGIVPGSPHTGYGYIKRGQHLSGPGFAVDKFIEKPNYETAERYLSEGGYYWNSGMFLFSARQYLAELSQYEPKILEACKAAIAAERHDLDFIRIKESAFAASPDISIDYAVMEKTAHAVVVPMDAGWSDVGSWGALCEIGKKDSNGNVLHGDVYLESVTNSYVRSESRLLAVVGVNDHVVVETPDAVLVAHKSCSEQVKKIVSQLAKDRRSEKSHHRVQYRPWGHHELLIDNAGFQVRRVVVNPGKGIDLQKHAMRSEHWVIIEGQATITCGDQQHALQANQSFYIPADYPHSIYNSGNSALVFIEVQVGQCLKEDDVVRL